MKHIMTLALLLFGLSLLPSWSLAQSQDVVLLTAGDISSCTQDGDTLTSDVLLQYPTASVLTLGDNVYNDGTLQQFMDCYDPTWGRVKDRTYPVTGNHDHHGSEGGYVGAQGFYDYFGNGQFGDPNAWYSFDLGAWHIVVLNSECNDAGVSLANCYDNSPQLDWLKADLAANPAPCILAAWHKPRFVSGSAHASSTRYSAFWRALMDAGADIVLSGHEHNYERLGRVDADGNPTPDGIRSFIVGTGGNVVYAGSTTPLPFSEARQGDTYGVLKLTLQPARFAWEFLPVAGKTYTDTGSENCTGAPSLSVDAGPDQSVASLGSADLSGSVANAAGSYTAVWSTVAQSCTPRFEAPTALVTRFSATCTYTLRLTATDTVTAAYDDMMLTVTGDAYAPPPTPTPTATATSTPIPTATPTPGAGGTVYIPITDGLDDVEERGTGSMYRDSSDIELVVDGTSVQTVGLRFLGLPIPQGATIISATIQFVVDEAPQTTATSLTIQAHNVGNAPAFTTATYNVSSRPRTTAQVAWSPGTWQYVSDAGPAQRTPNLASVVQEIVSRGDWTIGNAIAIIITGTGTRTARAYEKSVNAVAVLQVTWQ